MIGLKPLLYSFLFFAVSCHFSVCAQTRSVEILYFNDAHDLEPVQTDLGLIGGVSRMKTLVDSLRAVSPDAILIFGGDLGGGTLEGKLFKGTAMVEALNRLPVDLATFGQHDFDYGYENTLNLVSLSNFNWISTNIMGSDLKSIPSVSKYAIKRTGDTTVGFIGLTDKLMTSGGATEFIQQDLIKASEPYVKLLNDSCDYVVALTQMDLSLNEQLVRRYPEIDAVFTEETSQYKSCIEFVGNTPLISVAGNMGQLVRLCIDKFGGLSVSAHSVSQDLKPDSVIDRFVKSKYRESNSILNKVIAYLPDSLLGSIELTGNIVSNAFRNTLDADFGLIQGGGMRDVFRQNDVTTKTIWSILPFENKIYSVRLKGRDIIELVTSCYRINKNVAVSGLSLIVSEDKGNKGDLDLRLHNGSPINENSIYTIAIPEYLIDGGDGIDPIDHENIVKKYPIMDIDALEHYLSTNYPLLRRSM